MPRRPVSYAWARGASAHGLSEPAALGLGYAQRLAENARERSRLARSPHRRPFPLTPADIAVDEDVSETTVRRWIAQARLELYGTLSDSGIYYRRKQTEARREREQRACAAPDCTNDLPQRATARREYCHPRCRRRHHYQRHHPQARPAPHLRGERRSRVARSPEQLERTLAFLREYHEKPQRALRRAKQGRYRAEVRETATDDPPG